MEKSLKILSWVSIVLGILAIIGSVADQDVSGFIGGGLFLAEGWAAVLYMQKYK
jgi:hypothetical protein